jgi:hypothetical protein
MLETMDFVDHYDNLAKQFPPSPVTEDDKITTPMVESLKFRGGSEGASGSAAHSAQEPIGDGPQSYGEDCATRPRTLQRVPRSLGSIRVLANAEACSGDASGLAGCDESKKAPSTETQALRTAVELLKEEEMQNKRKLSEFAHEKVKKKMKLLSFPSVQQDVINTLIRTVDDFSKKKPNNTIEVKFELQWKVYDVYIYIYMYI